MGQGLLSHWIAVVSTLGEAQRLALDLAKATRVHAWLRREEGRYDPLPDVAQR